MNLAAADAMATATAGQELSPSRPADIAQRLQSIRQAVDEALEQYAQDQKPFVAIDPSRNLAWWGNGWHNGSWGNGWHNGGWGNGWHNGGWGNGWHNW